VVGQLTRGSTVPEFEGALETMREGEMLAEPVESRFGLHIILLERKIPGERLPFELV
jgi:peptidyl-prolyl cis-trans isomerase C